jgi:nucleoside-diphosphate-sugar epimerase
VDRLLASGIGVLGALRNPHVGTRWPGMPLTSLDLRKPSEVVPPAAMRGVDCIIHLAGRVHVMHPSHDERSLLQSENCMATALLAKQAVEQGVRRFIYVSSIKVNGEFTTSQPFQPDAAPRPRDAYAISKLAAERELLELAARHALEVAIVRPPLVYGPSVRGNFRSLIWLVRSGIPLPLRGINNFRSFVNVWNLAEFLEILATVPIKPSRIWMVSDGADVSTPELLSKIATAFNKRPNLYFLPVSLLEIAAKLSGNVAAFSRLAGSLQVDISHSLRDLPWRPKVTMDDALRRTASWYEATKGK